MKPTVEVFGPFSLGKKQMKESEYFPIIGGNNAIVVVPGTESLVYRVDVTLGEAAEAEEKGKLGIPIGILKAGETFHIPVDYIRDDRAGFHGYPYISEIKQY